MMGWDHMDIISQLSTLGPLVEEEKKEEVAESQAARLSSARLSSALPHKLRERRQARKKVIELSIDKSNWIITLADWLDYSK